MKALIVVSLLGFCLLGVMTASASAQAIGPSCLNIAEFAEVAQFFALPTGGGQLILTGQSLTFGDAYTGSGYLVGSDFTFSVASGLLPGLLEGVLNLSTGQGVGSVTFADTNEIQALTYSLSPPPCAAP
jgi:hypothetical protein